MKKGLLITLEGIEGAGKSSAAYFLAEYLKEKHIDFILTREPGGTEIAEEIRKIILAHHQEQMHPDTEMLLYFAGRAQHLNQIIIPTLNTGRWVISDRFTDATYAYQGGGRGLSQAKIAILENWVQGELRPDYTLLFDVAVTTGLTRIKNNRSLDRIEKEQAVFFEKVRFSYLARAAQEQQRFQIIDANQNFNQVKKQLAITIDKIIAKAKK